MGQDRKNDVTYVDIPYYLAAFAHVRVLLGAAGLELEDGVVVFVPDITKKKQVLHLLEAYGGVRKELHGSRLPEAYNHQMVLVEFQTFYKEENLQRFMKSDNFLPVIIAGGIIPEKLSDFRNVIVFDEINFDSECIIYQSNVYRKVTNYIHQNSEKIIFNIRNYQNSRCFIEDFELSIFQKCLMTVAMIFQKISYDMEAKLLAEEELKNILHVIYSVTDVLVGDGDVTECVRKMLAKYVEENGEIHLGRNDEIEGDLLHALKEKRGILYDDKFYYIPEELLRVATKPMSEILSFLAVKKALHREKTLICDETEENYTVKKNFISSFGETIRQRFLKIDREKLEKENALTLVERSELRCTSEIVRGKSVGWQLTRPTSQS